MGEHGAVAFPQPFGEYVLVGPLGQGGAAEVFLATRQGFSERLVVKLLRPELLEMPRARQRFEQEAQIAVRVDHPSLIRVLDVGVTDGQPFIAMDLVEGAPLSSVLQAAAEARRHLPVQSVLRILDAVAEGLDALHGAVDPDTGEPFGFVHRDVAPKNVIVTRQLSAVLIDFGIGKSNLRPWQTAVKARLGSPGYMSPEQLRSAAVDRRSDLFNLGILAYELLTIEPLLDRGAFAEMLQSSEAAESRRLTDARPELGLAAERVVLRMLSTDPDRRYPSGRAFMAALRPALEIVRLPEAVDDRWIRVVIDDHCREKIPALPDLPPRVEMDHSTEHTRIIARRESMDSDSLTLGGVSSTTSPELPHLSESRPETEAEPPTVHLARTLRERPSHWGRLPPSDSDEGFPEDETPTLLPDSKEPLRPAVPVRGRAARKATTGSEAEHRQSTTSGVDDAEATLPHQPLHFAPDSRTTAPPPVEDHSDRNATIEMASKESAAASVLGPKQVSFQTTPIRIALWMSIAILLGVLVASIGVRLWQGSIVPVEVPTAPVQDAVLD